MASPGQSEFKPRDAGSDDAAVVGAMIYALLVELGETKADLERYTEIANDLLGKREGFVCRLVETPTVAGPIGLITFSGARSHFAFGTYGDIQELYVTPEWRSSGVGRLLLDDARDVARQRGWTRLQVNAPDPKRFARNYQFYIKAGFEPIGPLLRQIF